MDEKSSRMPDWQVGRFQPSRNFPTEGDVWLAAIEIGDEAQASEEVYQRFAKADTEGHEAYVRTTAEFLSERGKIPEGVDPVDYANELFTHMRPPTLRTDTPGYYVSKIG